MTRTALLEKHTDRCGLAPSEKFENATVVSHESCIFTTYRRVKVQGSFYSCCLKCNMFLVMSDMNIIDSYELFTVFIF